MKHSYRTHLRLWLTALAGFFLLAVHAQSGAEVRIQGKVTDKQHSPITGVVVAVHGRQAGTTTGTDGTVSITARVGETLEISYLGYKKQQLKVTQAMTRADITLEEDALAVQDVVVIGYGTTSKEKLTGAVSTVSTADFKNRPITNVSLALQGKITGVYTLRDLNRNAVGAAVPSQQPLKTRSVSFAWIGYAQRYPRLYNRGICYINIFAIGFYNFIPP